MSQSEFLNALEELHIFVNSTQIKQLEKYYEILIEYNKVMNLTGITDKEEVYLKHFYDSLTLTKSIDFKGLNNVCDIGTGAGFPGLVLKIIFPFLKVTLVDSLDKRIQFLKKVVEELQLSNIECIHARAEEYALLHREEFDIVTARAVSSLPILLEYCVPVLKVNGHFLAMKGNIVEELDSSKEALKKLNCEIVDIQQFLLPKENSQRTILKIRKQKITDKKYPRKFSEMKKKPL